MIKINNSGERDIFDEWAFLGPKRKRIIKKSWAELFRVEALPKLPEYDVALLFSDKTGRLQKSFLQFLE